jgi:septum formation protein
VCRVVTTRHTTSLRVVTVSLVLASASPARKRLLRSSGVEPSIVVSEVDEEAVTARARETYGDLEPQDVALLLARAKAEDVAQQVAHAIVVGCDSVLELDGELHGKPSSPQEAVDRWRRMSGSTGVLHTGHWVVDTREEGDGGTGATLGATASTEVHFARLDDDEIAAYVATGEPLRVAGAFTLDGIGGPYVTGIEGDPSNVVGLSLPLLRELLGELDIPWRELRAPGVPT